MIADLRLMEDPGEDLLHLQLAITDDGYESFTRIVAVQVKLEQNFSNPFNPTTVINYSIA